MIEHYTDHAANERTFLAWVRTAIAVMAFGFLVEKFDLFLEVASRSLSGRVASPGGQMVGNVAGLLLILMGGATMVLATLRFRQTARDIDSKDLRRGAGARLDFGLVGLLVLLGATLFVYLSYTVVRRLRPAAGLKCWGEQAPRSTGDTMRNSNGAAAQARVLVIGGSAGGLLTAATLRRGGWRADVYEKSPVELVGRGAGIATHPELEQALDESGAGSAGLGLPVTYRLAFDRAGAVLARRHHPQIVTSWDRLHQIARQATPDDAYHLGHDLVGVTQTADGVTATFANGRSVTGDVLVGADGFRSAVRGIVLPDVQPEYAGYVIWRGLVDEAALPPALHKRIFDHFTFHFPPRNENIGYPIPGRDNDLRPGHRRYNWVWYTCATPEQLADILTDASGKRWVYGIPPALLRPDVVAAMRESAKDVVTQPLLEALDYIPQPFVTPIYDFCSPEFAFGRVALLGDAAVMARPHVGYGTTKAAGDAVALGRALNAALADGGDASAALRAYEAERQPVGRRTFLRSRQLGSWMGVAFPSGAADVPDDAELHTLPGILRHTGSNEFFTGQEPGWMMDAELGDEGDHSRASPLRTVGAKLMC